MACLCYLIWWWWSYLEEQTKADPLVVLVVSPLFGVYRFVDARMCHVEPDPLPEGTGYRVRGVDPAEGVEHLLRDVFCVDAVYWVADVLFCRHNEREGKHARRCHGVVQSEHPRVDVDVGDTE